MWTAFAGQQPFGQLLFCNGRAIVLNVILDRFDESQEQDFHGV